MTNEFNRMPCKIYTKQDIIGANCGYTIENEVIIDATIKFIGHFGDVPMLTLICDSHYVISNRNNTKNIGFMLRFIMQFLDLSEEDGYSLSALTNTPIRVIVNDGKVCGFGHFIKDRFVMIEDFCFVEWSCK